MLDTLLYILCIAGTTYLVRVIPLTLLRKPIRNRTLRSFLFYVPYVTLAVMTFPAILKAPGSMAAGAAALIVAVLLAFFRKGLFTVAVAACVTVFVLELFFEPPAFLAQWLASLF
ncbi:MAG: AzlD domain-containing protein [Clostridia bacterium]|nr:AzlD domain-containing protein [Clostridia bacterium]